MDIPLRPHVNGSWTVSAGSRPACLGPNLETRITASLYASLNEALIILLQSHNGHLSKRFVKSSFSAKRTSPHGFQAALFQTRSASALPVLNADSWRSHKVDGRLTPARDAQKGADY
jgi:hypothetical protein